MTRRILIASALVLAVFAATASPAPAHKAKYRTILEIDTYLFEGAFEGTVGSLDEPKCDARRKVTVWGENPGAMDGPLGTVKTDKRGNWRLDALVSGGTFYATTPKKTLKKSGEHKHLCKADQSHRFTAAR